MNADRTIDGEKFAGKCIGFGVLRDASLFIENQKTKSKEVNNIV